MKKQNNIILGHCLSKSLKDIEKYPNKKLMMGPPAFSHDSAHFWTEDDNQVYEHIKNIPKTYKYIGKEVNPDLIRKEIGI